MNDLLSNFDTAVVAYRENCDRLGTTFQQPSEEHSLVTGSMVYLRNSPTGYVARYNMKRNRILL
jgi:hypothetical protein